VKGAAGAVLLLLALLVPAGAAAGTEEEIAHLLQYIEGSGCVFVRNGKEHDSADAREHIAKKYDYVRKRVKAAEDFIGRAATKSSMTGQAYRVRCEGTVLPTAEWLKDELERFRQGKISLLGLEGTLPE
jgi:hypothetical protein